VRRRRRLDEKADGRLGEEHDRLAGQDVRLSRVEAVVAGPDQGRPGGAVGLVPRGMATVICSRAWLARLVAR
jgi:hypothetical protein